MTLVLKNVNKHFSNAEEPTLNDVNMEIQRGSQGLRRRRRARSCSMESL